MLNRKKNTEKPHTAAKKNFFVDPAPVERIKTPPPPAALGDKTLPSPPPAVLVEKKLPSPPPSPIDPDSDDDTPIVRKPPIKAARDVFEFIAGFSTSKLRFIFNATTESAAKNLEAMIKLYFVNKGSCIENGYYEKNNNFSIDAPGRCWSGLIQKEPSYKYQMTVIFCYDDLLQANAVITLLNAILFDVGIILPPHIKTKAVASFPTMEPRKYTFPMTSKKLSIEEVDNCLLSLFDKTDALATKKLKKPISETVTKLDGPPLAPNEHSYLP